MCAIEPVSGPKSNEKLASICARASISHAQQSTLVVTDVKVFVWELGSVDRKTASAIMVCKVTSLCHKILDHAMERTALVGVLVLVVSSAQRSEVFSCLGDVICIKLQLFVRIEWVLLQIGSLR